MSTDVPTAQAPRFGTVAALLLVAAFTITALVIQAAAARHFVGVFGWNTGPDGTTVTSITPGYPAANAGIEPGDEVDFSSLSLLGRINTVLPQALYEGAPLTVRFTRSGREHTVTMIARAFPAFTARDVAAIASSLLIIALGMILVLVRPGRMTVGFLLIGIGAIANDFVYRFGSPDILLVTSMAYYLGSAIGWAGLLMFVSRFPSDTSRGWLAMLDRAAIPAVCVYGALELYVGADLLRASHPPGSAIMLTMQYVFPALVALTALAALISAGLAAQGDARQRLIPVIVLFGLWTALTANNLILNSVVTSPLVLTYLPIVASALLVLFAVAVTYGTIRHRVIDVSFIISRTLVYSLLTVMLIGVFAIIDILVARWLEHSQLAVIVELVAAVLMGAWLKAMHHRVDAFVDSVLFRRRHRAERRLAHVATTLPHAASLAFVDEALVVEPIEALDLASSALFRRARDGDFERCYARGWDDGSASSLDASDHLVVQLKADLDAVNLSDVRWPRSDIPTGLYQPLLAVPIVVRHQLEAFTLYGGHSGGEALDPDEVRSLRQLATPAGAAYDHLEAEALRAQLELLHAANAALQREHKADVGALDLLPRQMEAINESLHRQTEAIEELLRLRRLTAD